MHQKLFQCPVFLNALTDDASTIEAGTPEEGSSILQLSSPRYLRDLITVQPSGSTRSSTLITLLQPPVDSSLKITNRSFRYAAPHLWNELHSIFVFLVTLVHHHHPALLHPQANPGLVVDISHGVFHSRLKTYLFSESFPP